MDTVARTADDPLCEPVMSHRMLPRCEPSWSRRGFLGTLMSATVLGASIVQPRAAHAGNDRVVTVPDQAFATVIAAIADTDLALTLDPTLPPATMRIGDASVSLADRLLLKGQGATRHRFLDDARNAPKLGAAVRDQLRARWPELGDAFAERHKAWSRALVRNILRWTQTLDRTGLRGKRVRDPQGWIYLLEWAGAEVTTDGIEPPSGLHDAPRQPASTTPQGYQDYVQALVDALR
jgi:hypothetical protein